MMKPVQMATPCWSGGKNFWLFLCSTAGFRSRNLLWGGGSGIFVIREGPNIILDTKL